MGWWTCWVRTGLVSLVDDDSRMMEREREPTLGHRIASGVAAVVFAYAVFVQFNDVDPIRWVLVYGSASVVSALEAWGRLGGRRIPAVIGGVACAWAGLLVFQAVGAEGIAAVELWREIGGLLVVGLWMTWIWQTGLSAVEESR